jgi:tetratricopeptide (TPR) repeat protein
LRTGRIAEAEQSFNEAANYANEGEKRALAGNFGCGGVGDEHTRAGRYQDAVRAYEKAVGLDPDSKDLQDKLNKARKKSS